MQIQTKKGDVCLPVEILTHLRTGRPFPEDTPEEKEKLQNNNGQRAQRTSYGEWFGRTQVMRSDRPFGY
jgi:hypothetical protein